MSTLQQTLNEIFIEAARRKIIDEATKMKLFDPGRISDLEKTKVLINIIDFFKHNPNMTDPEFLEKCKNTLTDCKASLLRNNLAKEITVDANTIFKQLLVDGVDSKNALTSSANPAELILIFKKLLLGEKNEDLRPHTESKDEWHPVGWAMRHILRQKNYGKVTVDHEVIPDKMDVAKELSQIHATNKSDLAQIVGDCYFLLKAINLILKEDNFFSGTPEGHTRKTRSELIEQVVKIKNLIEKNLGAEPKLKSETASLLAKCVSLIDDSLKNGYKFSNVSAKSMSQIGLFFKTTVSQTSELSKVLSNNQSPTQENESKSKKRVTMREDLNIEHKPEDDSRSKLGM